jgi:hypothetical protein
MRNANPLCTVIENWKRKSCGKQTACQKCKGVNVRSVGSHHLSDTPKIKESSKKLWTCLDPSCLHKWPRGIGTFNVIHGSRLYYPATVSVPFA